MFYKKFNLENLNNLILFLKHEMIDRNRKCVSLEHVNCKKTTGDYARLLNRPRREQFYIDTATAHLTITIYLLPFSSTLVCYPSLFSAFLSILSSFFLSYIFLSFPLSTFSISYMWHLCSFLLVNVSFSTELLSINT